MRLIYKVNTTKKNSSPENATLNETSDDRRGDAANWTDRITQAVHLCTVGSVECASVYNCRPLCRGYSVFIASLKRRKYQTAYKHWSPQQPVSASVPCESTSRK